MHKVEWIDEPTDPPDPPDRLTYSHGVLPVAPPPEAPTYYTDPVPYDATNQPGTAATLSPGGPVAVEFDPLTLTRHYAYMPPTVYTTPPGVAGSAGGIGYHTLLNGLQHPDTAAGVIVTPGAIIYATADPLQWNALAVGDAESLLYVASTGLPAWKGKGSNGGFLITYADVLTWMTPPAVGGVPGTYVMTITNSNPAWLTPPTSDGDTYVQTCLNGVISWVKSETQTVVTAAQYDTSSHVIQVKTRSVKVVPVGAESAWTTIETAVDCTAV
jgi:hypothetical protein